MNYYSDAFAGGKRHILVADDEYINREMLENILSEEYDVLKTWLIREAKTGKIPELCKTVYDREKNEEQ